MAKKNFWPGILAMVLVFGLWFAACSTDSGEKYDPIVYTSKDSGGKTYKLEITKNTGKAAFTPESGDNYKLTITYANGTTKTSRGAVSSYSSTAITFVGATSFTVTITTSGTMTKIEGTIPLDDNTTVTAPGAVTPVNSNPGGGPTPPAANPFANTTWKWEGANPSVARYWSEITLSFGTNTWTMTILHFINETHKLNETFTANGTYTASGNTATMSGDWDTAATISGNVLTLDEVPLPLTRVK